MMNKKGDNNMPDSLGDRMKNNYENRAKTYLTRRTPVIMRIDGRAFHTFTKDFGKPYDHIFREAMNRTALYLYENIQGCRLAYTQSDEISLLLIDYDNLNTQAWFDYGVQKLCSVAASMATLSFMKAFHALMPENNIVYDRAFARGATFDARCFNIPESEVANYFIWRQQDATRNAIESLGRCFFSDKELYKKSCNDIQNMLWTEKHVNFNEMATDFKRGTCVKDDEIDKEIPIFTQNRNYIEGVFSNIKV